MHHAAVSAAGEMISASSLSGEMQLCRASQRFSRRAKVVLSLLLCPALRFSVSVTLLEAAHLDFLFLSPPEFGPEH